MATHRKRIVVFGAGALGMGFLGPEFSGHCEIGFADIHIKADVLNLMRREGAYCVNIRGTAPYRVRVEGVAGFDLSREDQRQEALDWAGDSSLVFTAVGEPNLPKLAATLAPAFRDRPGGQRLAILCSENGRDIAHKFTQALSAELGGALPEGITVGDTVMGRMCQWLNDSPAGIEPLAPGAAEAVVVEPFFGIPCLRNTVDCIDLPGDALEPMSAEEFDREEDIKLLAHNGLHFFLACLGFLRGHEHFNDLQQDAFIMDLAREMMSAEVGKALLLKHANLSRTTFDNYSATIMRRITCPSLRDSIARGVRGVYRKLSPDERVVVGARTILEAGVAPRLYLLSLPAALEVHKRTEGEEVPLDAALKEQCGVDDKDHLWDLAREAQVRLRNILGES